MLKGKNLLFWVIMLVIPFALIFLSVTTLTRTITVNKQSMEPTLTEDQRLLLWRPPYIGPFSFLGGPSRGEIVVLKEPTQGKLFIKRVIGLPGETLEGRNGILYINGKPFEELYLSGRVRTKDFAAVEVPAKSYFVAGDNRDVSLDSRAFGPVSRDAIIGVAFLSIMPLDRFGTFNNPVK